MKKNKMMRAAGVLLIAVLLTTSLISGTFAKYVTTGSASDNARVAKFGVNVSTSGKLFSEQYAAPTADDTITVSSTDKVVAPGTNGGDGLTVTVSGTPEVSVQVTYALELTKDIFLKTGTYSDPTGQTGSVTPITNYYPITWTITSVKDPSKTKTGTIAQINTWLNENVNNTTYDPGTNLATELGNYTLTWAWDFGDPTYNFYDTILGSLAADGSSVKKSASGNTNADITEDLVAGTDYSLEIAVALTVTVTQVD